MIDDPKCVIMSLLYILAIMTATAICDTPNGTYVFTAHAVKDHKINCTTTPT